MAEQRILIAGAEALGSVYGGMRARNGEQVTQRGRTEIDALNGKVVKLAARHGLNADTNRLLCALTRASQRQRRGGGAEGT